MGALTTHVLDLQHGRPARGLTLALYVLGEGVESGAKLLDARTNADGRCDAPLLQGDALVAGRYRLVFDVGDYFRERGVDLPDPAFFDRVAIDFGVADPNAHYHVPLLISPHGYSTYRGS